ncbi:MAG: hypothetical protein ACLFSC_08325 [Wenzhouxiangella sp.]
MSGEPKARSHQDALAAYLDELLQPEPAAQPVPEPGVLLPCGRVLQDDPRYYLFAAAGLSLAIPAVRVSAEQPFAGAVTGDEGAVVKRLSRPAGEDVPVFDLARLMLPPSAAVLNRPLQQRASTLVMLDDGQWALAAEGAGDLEALDREQVCWRGQQATRAWLAGTVAARRLALLDLDVLAGMLP